MPNIFNSKIEKIFSRAKRLPYFTVDDLAGLETDRNYLKTLLSRYEKGGRVIRLKRGTYVARDYLSLLKERRAFEDYKEFVSNLLYTSSYLSLEYMLSKHNLLTEMPVVFTAVSDRTTANFENELGRFSYRKISKPILDGVRAVKRGSFTILSATKAKALFDYLYLRKDDIVDDRAIEELRINTDELTGEDRRELSRYVAGEGSKKMKWIISNLH